MSKKGDYQDYVIRIRPFHYLHIKDTNKNVVTVVTGPQTLTCLDHEKVVFGPEKMVVIPPRHYVIIDNPVKRVEQVDPNTGERIQVVVTDELGQAIVRHGDQEVRFNQPPFPLYEGEKASKIFPLQLVEENTALRLKAKRDFKDRYPQEGKKAERLAGEEWLFEGPATYYPQVEVDVLNTIRAVVLKPNQALKVRARDDCYDYQKKKRKAGEEWLVKMEGAYLPGVNEEVVETLQAYILTDQTALHVRAKSTFTDSDGTERKAGTEWLVTNEREEAYIPGVYEEVTRQVNLIVLTKRDFCVILDPVDENGNNQLGEQKLVKGEKTFFLKPGEKLQGSIQKMLILSPDDALWLTANEEFIDTHGGKNIRRRPGDVWLLYGPGEYCVPLEAKLQKQIKAFLKIDALKYYFFQPAYFFGAIFGFVFLLYILVKFFKSSPTHSDL